MSGENEVHTVMLLLTGVRQCNSSCSMIWLQGFFIVYLMYSVI